MGDYGENFFQLQILRNAYILLKMHAHGESLTRKRER